MTTGALNDLLDGVSDASSREALEGSSGTRGNLLRISRLGDDRRYMCACGLTFLSNLHTGALSYSALNYIFLWIFKVLFKHNFIGILVSIDQDHQLFVLFQEFLNSNLTPVKHSLFKCINFYMLRLLLFISVKLLLSGSLKTKMFHFKHY